jgi:hypothetical protein
MILRLILKVKAERRPDMLSGVAGRIGHADARLDVAGVVSITRFPSPEASYENCTS